jgi:hypothetical protein
MVIASLIETAFIRQKGETQLAIKEAALKGAMFSAATRRSPGRMPRRAASLAGLECHDVKPKDNRRAPADERHARMDWIPYGRPH